MEGSTELSLGPNEYASLVLSTPIWYVISMKTREEHMCHDQVSWLLCSDVHQSTFIAIFLPIIYPSYPHDIPIILPIMPSITHDIPITYGFPWDDHAACHLRRWQGPCLCHHGRSLQALRGHLRHRSEWSPWASCRCCFGECYDKKDQEILKQLRIRGSLNVISKLEGYWMILVSFEGHDSMYIIPLVPRPNMLRSTLKGQTIVCGTSRIRKARIPDGVIVQVS